MSCERCRELVLLVEVRAMAVATAEPPMQGTPTWVSGIAARQELHRAADELATHMRREHLARREAG